MSEKKLSREKLDAGIELVRRYYHDDDETVLNEMLDVTNKAGYEAGLTMHTIVELLTSILRCNGLKGNATNEDIYKVLEVLGWQVVADESAEH